MPENRLKKLKLCLAFAGSGLLFFIVLELLSWSALKLGFEKHHSPQYPLERQSDTSKPPPSLTTRQKYLWDYMTLWRKFNPSNSKNLPSGIEGLSHEPDAIWSLGEETGKSLFKKMGVLEKGVSDFYEIKGALSGRRKFRIKISTDSYGRRITGTESLSRPEMNVIFLGCSFTFGHGVNDTESFPYQFGAKTKNIQVYNFGISGSSPSDELLRIRKNAEYFDGIDTTLPTFIVYTFINDHVLRVLGTSSYRPPPEVPSYYPYLQDGQIAFEEEKPGAWNVREIYRTYGKTNLARFAQIELPIQNQSQDILISKVFLELKNELSQKFPSLRDFIVVPFPGEIAHFSRILPHLTKEKISVIDYSGINRYGFLGSQVDLQTDRHPSKEMYDFFSGLLVNDLIIDHHRSEKFNYGMGGPIGWSGPGKAVQ